MPPKDQLEDKYKEVGDIWTAIRGHKLFLYHYLRQNKEMPLSNPWTTNLGRLVVPNVFSEYQIIGITYQKVQQRKKVHSIAKWGSIHLDIYRDYS